MAEGIAFDIATKLLLSLGSIAIKEIVTAWGFKEELEKLKVTVSTIKNVLLDAQEKQVSSNAVKDWLKGLKQILLDADDLFDEVATEAKIRETETHDSFGRKVRNLFPSFRPEVGREIKAIVNRLDHIVSLMEKFQFIVKEVEKPSETIKREETFSRVNSRSIIGRRDDRDAFVRLLLSFGDQENVLVIPIVGIGGLGKTTLAQLIYRHGKIQSKFPKRLWVSVSTNFDYESLLIKILKAGGECDNSCSNKGRLKLEDQVTSMLRAEKFLLFLDDVWNENDLKWKELEDLLIKGASGSRIVVTTRSMTVASMVKTTNVEPYKLRGLSDRESLKLLLKLAFKEGEEKMHAELVNIGNEIVKNCGGVPLALVTLGSHLSKKRVEQDWENAMGALAQRENKNDILPVLRVSYDEMPSNLKQCFAYCSLFKRDEIIDGKKLLYSWMAQGFVQQDGNRELEDIGETYILELVNRFFLEPYDGQTFYNTSGREHYKMHSLVHRLAQNVAGNECLTIKGALPDAIPDTLRHVASDSETYSKFPRPLMEAKKLRTIFYRSEKNPPFRLESKSFRCLRVCEDRISPPKKIRELKLLRYLSLDEVDNLPKSLCNLLNLQYLDLSLSRNLKLPEDFEKLINLRFLCLSTKLERLPNKGIGMLKSLRTLIISHCEALKSLDEGIGQLSCLRELALESCSNLLLLPASFRKLTSLKRLEISSCLKLKLSSDDDLKGLTSLKQLKLRNLSYLVSLPKGLLDAAGKLTHLEIGYCRYFTSPCKSVLPKLISLESLKIWDCEKVDSLPEGMENLTLLKFVRIVGCPIFTTNYEKRAAEKLKIDHVPKKEIF